MKFTKFIMIMLICFHSNYSIATNACMPFCDTGCTGVAVTELGSVFSSGITGVIQTCINTNTSILTSTSTFIKAAVSMLNTTNNNYTSTYNSLDVYAKSLSANIENTGVNFRFSKDSFNEALIEQLTSYKDKRGLVNVNDSFSIKSSSSSTYFNTIKELKPSQNEIAKIAKDSIFSVLSAGYSEAVLKDKNNRTTSLSKLKSDLILSLRFTKEKQVITSEELKSLIHTVGVFYESEGTVKDVITQLSLNALLDGRVSDNGSTEYSLIWAHLESEKNQQGLAELIAANNEVSAVRTALVYNQIKLGLLHRLISLKKARNLIKSLKVSMNDS